MPSIGTRTKQGTRQGHISGRGETQSHTRDLGLSKKVTASITFVGAGTNQLQAANGTFAAFAVGDDMLVEGTNLNNGTFHVNAIDGTNHAFLTVDVGCHAEGPLSATVRTI